MNHLNNISNIDLKELSNIYQGDELEKVIEEVKNGYPVQYKIGYVNFYGNKINVNESVLIPRFETEFLVDYVKNILPKESAYNIIDIGTGSGCIAISVAKIFNSSHVEGIDISKKAIDVAIKNMKENNVDNVIFNVKDIFSVDNFDKYDVIISNPPYVSREEKVGIETKYEPQNAIFAEKDGLIFYEKILEIVSKTRNKIEIFLNITLKLKRI